MADKDVTPVARRTRSRMQPQALLQEGQERLRENVRRFVETDEEPMREQWEQMLSAGPTIPSPLPQIQQSAARIYEFPASTLSGPPEVERSVITPLRQVLGSAIARRHEQR